MMGELNYYRKRKEGGDKKAEAFQKAVWRTDLFIE
jgi:hypothetical protein